MNNLFCVSGKNVLVTGGSRGIGYMIASGFVEAGANVLLTSRDINACEKACNELNEKMHSSTNSSCHYVTSDVSTREGCEKLAEHVAGVFNNRLDVLVNNAGTSWGEPPSRNSKTNWGFDKVLDLNVKGIFYLTNACLPMLQHDGCSPEDPSRVINIGSVAGITPQQAPTHAYDISKAAVHHLTKKLSYDLAIADKSKPITVNCIAPGYFETRMSKGLKTWGADSEQLTSQVPLGRLGSPDDIAGACIYLSSRAGAWCTGVVLPVDGGCIGSNVIPLQSNL